MLPMPPAAAHRKRTHIVSVVPLLGAIRHGCGPAPSNLVVPRHALLSIVVLSVRVNCAFVDNRFGEVERVADVCKAEPIFFGHLRRTVRALFRQDVEHMEHMERIERAASYEANSCWIPTCGMSKPRSFRILYLSASAN